jgi:hypothetical protein
MGFVVDEMTMGQVFLRTHLFLRASYYSIHISSEVGSTSLGSFEGLGLQVKEGEIGRSCSKHGGNVLIAVWWERQKRPLGRRRYR